MENDSGDKGVIFNDNTTEIFSEDLFSKPLKGLGDVLNGNPVDNIVSALKGCGVQEISSSIDLNKNIGPDISKHRFTKAADQQRSGIFGR